MATPGTTSNHPFAVGKSGMSRGSLVERLRQLAWLTPDREFSRLYGEALAQLEQELHHYEEGWLDECDPDEWREHVELHARILDTAHHVRSRVMRGELAVGREAAQLMADWFSGYSAAMAHARATLRPVRSQAEGDRRYYWTQ